MADAPKPEAGNPTTDSKTEVTSAPQSSLPPATNGGIPAGAPTMASVRVEGIAELVTDVRHELHLIGRASKFEWVNKRLILLRNFVIALSVIVALSILTLLIVREAYKETLSIAAFSVPEKLGDRGITGQVVAQNLFDELIKRRTTVTTLDAGELKSAWSEHRSDVAVPDTKFTLQSVLRYLRSLTGREIAVDGEMLVDGEDVTIRARVQGKPPRVAKGKLANWESLMGELADYVFEVTQPVVLASYWGLTAKEPGDVEKVAQLVRRMEAVDAGTTSSALSVAYYAYGRALQRLDAEDEAALIAWDRARTLDPKFGLPYLATAGALYERDAQASDRMFVKAASLDIGKENQSLAQLARFRLSMNTSDCARAQVALAELDRLGAALKLEVQVSHARYEASCEYRQAKGTASLHELAQLNADIPFQWNYLGIAESGRQLHPRLQAEGPRRGGESDCRQLDSQKYLP